MNDRADRTSLLQTICTFGLGMRVQELSRSEVKRQLLVIDRLLKEHEALDLHLAARYGMPNVWPFNQDGGRPYDARDLQDNITKARAVVARMRRSGNLPRRIQVG